MSEVVTRNELPEGWIEVPLADCVDILDSQRVPLNSKQRADRIEGKLKSELYPYYGATGAVGFIDDFIFEGEHLLLGEDAAPFFDKSKTVAYIANGKFWVNNHAHILSARRSITSNKYLLHYLNRFNYTGYVNGTTRLKLNQGNLKTIPVPLAPLEQQKRIVAKIEELFSHIDAGIAALKKAKQLLKQYRQSVLKAAVTGELTKQWRDGNKDKLESASQLLERILQERRQKWEAQQLEQFKAKGKVPKDDKWKGKYKEPEEVVLAGLPELPDEWIWARLDSIAFVGTGMSVSKSRKVIDPIDVAYLRVANVQRGYLVLDKMKTMPIEKGRLTDLELQEWDVLYNEGGDIDKLGRGWIWENQVKPCITQNHVFRASPYIKERYHSIFLSNWGNTFGQEYFIDTGKQTTNLASINKGVLSAFPTPLAPIEEQKKIIEIVEEKLASISHLETQVNIQLIKAEKNKQSILASAFSGK